MDVTPRESMDVAPREAPARTPRRRWWGIVAVVLVLAGLAFVATRALGEATLFFYNADEAVAKRDELGDRRFQVQGTVVEGTVVDSGDVVEFVITHNGVDVQVVHRGDPPEMFRPGMPVVLQGRWDLDDDVFTSDRMLVKHDDEYEADHPDRVSTTAPADQEP